MNPCTTVLEFIALHCIVFAFRYNDVLIAIKNVMLILMFNISTEEWGGVGATKYEGDGTNS